MILTEMGEGSTKRELIDWIRERFGIEQSQAKRDLSWLAEGGYLKPVVDERDRRVRRVYRTEDARAQIVRKREGILSFDFLKDRPPLTFRKGLPARATIEDDLLDLAQDEVDGLECADAHASEHLDLEQLGPQEEPSEDDVFIRRGRDLPPRLAH
jgi:DNA-binding MarR family transcriptional regulator